MRITQISVTKLFGTFNHTITLNLDDRITLIHGPNGVGKTTILKLVDSLFNKLGDELRNIPFQELTILFNDNSKLSLVNNFSIFDKKDTQRKSRQDFRFLLTYDRQNQKILEWPTNLRIDPREFRIPLSFVERLIPQLERISATRWLDQTTGEIFSFDSIIQRWGDRFPSEFRNIKPSWPVWFEEFFKDISIRFIHAQRLLLLNKVNDETSSRSRVIIDTDRDTQVSEAVINYSSQLRDIIRQKLAESSTLTQSLDRSFPQRLIKTYKDRDVMSKEELIERLTKVEEKRQHLISVGLYDPEKESISNPEINNDNIQRVLSVYVKDVENKLSVFDELAGRIELFETLLNSHFNYKKLKIDKEKGFLFETDKGILSASNLSSGEQHELVLIYELLFLTKKETLVLIDEPELSLHVGWQLRFLEDLQQIIEKTQINALIATHSPQIINNRWDLTVKLDGES